jgi:PAS domain-containing protein
VCVVETLIVVVTWVGRGRPECTFAQCSGCCPPAVTMQTPARASVLCGDFSPSGGDESRKRDMELFESVFLRLPDAIMCADMAMQIKQANFACAALRGGRRGMHLAGVLEVWQVQGQYRRTVRTPTETKCSAGAADRPPEP